MSESSYLTKSCFNGLDKYWLDFIQEQRKQDYFIELEKFLLQESQSKVLLPEKEKIFAAFEKTSFDNCKVILIGQDPYQNPGLPVGLSFSVPKESKIPPSLRNIYHELLDDPNLDFTQPAHGDLSHWAQKGVLMINAAFTVTQSHAGSHLKKGWLRFTEQLLSKLNKDKKHLVFLSWGTFAHSLTKKIDTQKHLVLRTSHPSFFSKNKEGADFKAFSGSRCFSTANTWLKEKVGQEIQWSYN